MCTLFCRDCGVSEHLWFSLEVTVDPAPSENSYTIQGHVFSSSISELLIDNPYAYPLELQVRCCPIFLITFSDFHVLYKCFVLPLWVESRMHTLLSSCVCLYVCLFYQFHNKC